MNNNGHQERRNMCPDWGQHGAHYCVGKSYNWVQNPWIQALEDELEDEMAEMAREEVEGGGMSEASIRCLDCGKIMEVPGGICEKCQWKDDMESIRRTGGGG